MSNKDREDLVMHIMNAGFKRAAASFTKLVGQQVRITNSAVLLIRHGNDSSFITEEEGNIYVLTTSLMGSITGKSYLIFSAGEVIEICKVLGTKISDQLRDGFLLEIDNIISAAVISELGDKLATEVYGDVPHLHYINSSKLQDLINGEVMNEETSNILFSNATFHFESGDHVHPQFIWKLSSRIFDIIPEEIFLEKK